jgi:hypothetical protein
MDSQDISLSCDSSGEIPTTSHSQRTVSAICRSPIQKACGHAGLKLYPSSFNADLPNGMSALPHSFSISRSCASADPENPALRLGDFALVRR